MNLLEHYTVLYNESVDKISEGDWELDPHIDSPSDHRMGVTLIIRPDEKVKSEISKFINELHAIDPGQYYYPASDIHITVMSIISCYNGFNLGLININSYIDMIQKSLTGCNSFEIEFRGITASPSCIMIQGFPSNNTLDIIRNNLRDNFINSELEQTIDARYAIRTAHSTVVRFRKPLVNLEKTLETMENYREAYFGKRKVDDLKLTHNDWYQRKEFAKELHSFKLSQ